MNKTMLRPTNNSWCWIQELNLIENASETGEEQGENKD